MFWQWYQESVVPLLHQGNQNNDMTHKTHHESNGNTEPNLLPFTDTKLWQRRIKPSMIFSFLFTGFT